MKDEILNQIKSEMRYKQQDEKNLRDAEYFTALLQKKQSKNTSLREAHSATKQSQIDLHAELTRRLRALSGLPEKVSHENKLPELKKTYDKLDKYISVFPPTRDPKNIVLIGGAGTGKTHAAQYAGARLLDRGFSVIFTTAFSLVQRFKDYIFNFEHAALGPLLTCDLLIIDDLGTEPKIKNISDEYLLNVINERLANNSPFLITTNLSPDDILARYDERLTSRILSKQSSVVIEMKGKDLRLN